MKPHRTPQCDPRRGAFTLIELLVVISIIAVLASLTVEAVLRAKGKARVMTARKDIADINTAIHAYKAEYGGRVPLGFSANADVTFGSAAFGTGLSNSHPVGILLAVTNSANGVTNANTIHRYNPRKLVCLTAKQLDATEVKKQGIGGDGTFRDPWENPYIISMDADQDGWCTDAFYSQPAVSSQSTNVVTGVKTGYDGWMENNPAGSPNVFRLRAESLVWSFGPDGKADAATAANVGDNKDNIVSWK